MINSLLRSSVNQWFATIRNDTDYRRKKIGSTFGFSIVVFIFYLIGKNLLRSAVDHFGDVAIITAINALIGIGLFVLFKDVVETTMKNFYEAREVPLLLTFPIRKSILFSMRFVELIAANLIGVFLWLLPPWIAFGQICGLNGKYYAIFSVIAFLILITIISHTVLLILGLINLFSSRRLISIFRWIAMICGLVVITAISLSMIGIDEIDELTKSLLTRIDLSQMRWLPTQPIAELMTIWIDPSSGEIWRSIAKFLINSIIWTAIAIGFGTLTFHRSWEIYHRQTEHRKKRMIFRFHLIWKTKIGGMMIKDFWLFVRRKGQILVVTMFSLILAVIVLIFANALARSKEPIYPVFAFCTQVVIYSVMLGSAMTWGGFRSEVWWFLRTHPISAKLIFASKSAVACVLSGGYAFFWITLILLIAKLPIRSILLINAIAIASIFASTIFNTAIGTLPWICEAEPQNKRPILRIWTIVLTVILNLILSIGSMIFWQVTALGELDLRLSSNVIELIVSIAIFSVLGVVSLISYFFGVRNLRKLLH